jgi:hypothetical protein
VPPIEVFALPYVLRGYLDFVTMGAQMLPSPLVPGEDVARDPGGGSAIRDASGYELLGE